MGTKIKVLAGLVSNTTSARAGRKYAIHYLPLLLIPSLLMTSGESALAAQTSLVASSFSVAQSSEKRTYIIRPSYNIDLATISPGGKQELDNVAKELKGATVTHIKVIGHTDSSVIRDRSKSQYPDNYALSRARASNVAAYLKQILNLDDSQLTIDGRGPDVALASNATTTGRAKNRRVELLVTTAAVAAPVVPEVMNAEPEPVAGTLPLQDVVRKVVLSNPDILIQVNERRSRNDEVDQARAGYLPTLDLTAGIGAERSRNTTTRAQGRKSRDLTREEASLNARQMLFDGFATRSEVERQQARVQSSAYTVHGTAENTALDTVEAYINLKRTSKLLSLAQNNLRAHERTYDQIKLRSDAGVGRRADLEQVSGRLALAHSNVIAALSVYDDALTSYIRVVGEAPSGALVKPALSADVLPNTQDEAIEMAVSNHPTLKSANADVEATKAQYRAAKHSFLPRFDFELSQSMNNDLDGQEGTNYDTQAMVRMQYNLLNGGADAARKRQTAHLINEAKEVRNRTHRQVIETIRLSWNAYKASEQQLSYLAQHVESATNTRDAYQKQFNIGQRTLLDLLNAENELFQAEQSYTGAEYDNLFARYRILNGQGKLLKTLDIELPDEASLAQR